MPEMQSYTQTVKRQVSPVVNELLVKTFDGFSEKIKNPNSPERKLLDTMIALTACAMLLEKIANEINAIANYLEGLDRQLDDSAKTVKPMVFGEDIHEEEKLEEVNIDKILSRITSELASIQQRKLIVEAEFKKNMGSLETRQRESLREFVRQFLEDYKSGKLQADLSEKSMNDISEFYWQRELQREEVMSKLQSMVKAHSTDESSGKVNSMANTIKMFFKNLRKNDDEENKSDTREKELAVSRQEAQKRLEHGLEKEEKVRDARYDNDTQIILIGMLKEEFGDKYPLSVLSKLAAGIHAQENGFTLLKLALCEDRDETIKRLDQQAQAIDRKQAALRQKRDERKETTLRDKDLQPRHRKQEEPVKTEEEEEEEKKRQLTPTLKAGPPGGSS